MKKTKFVSVVLALMLVLSLALPVMAEGEEPITVAVGGGEGKITIENARAKQTYELYRVFDLEDGNYNFTNNAYRYTLNQDWKGLLDYKYTPKDENGEYLPVVSAKDFVDEDDFGYIVWVAETNDAKEFGKLLTAYIDENHPPMIESVTTPDLTDAEKEAGKNYQNTELSVVFKELPFGYYLVKSSLGTLVSLDTTNKDATMKEKNEVPSSKKEIEKIEVGIDNKNPNGSLTTDEEGQTGSVGIGSIIKYKVTVTAQPGSKSLIYHDIMDEALDIDFDTLTVKVGGVELNESFYQLDRNPDHVDGNVKDKLGADCRFDVIFDEDYLNNIVDPTNIVISYECKVNEKAVAGSDVKNKGQISFGGGTTDDPVGPPDEPKVTPWEFEVFKYTNVEANEGVKADPLHPLDGAQFILSTKDDLDLTKKPESGDEVEAWYKDNNVLPFRFLEGEKRTEKAEGKDDVVVDVYQYYPENVRPENDQTEIQYEFTTGENGKFFLSGLSAGTYYLYETKAPASYNPLKNYVRIVIDDEGQVEAADNLTYLNPNYDSEDENSKEIITMKNQMRVENKTGLELPSTGGIGTTIFYVVGGCLCVGAVVLLITKRRMNIGRE